MTGKLKYQKAIDTQEISEKKISEHEIINTRKSRSKKLSETIYNQKAIKKPKMTKASTIPENLRKLT